MIQNSQRLNALTAFAAVAREGGFTRAAEALSVSPSALSQAIRSLERDTGVRLFNRTTRHVTLTESGVQFLADIAPALVRIDAAFEALEHMRGHPTGLLRINSSRLAINLFIAPKLSAFMALYPQLRVELFCDDTLADIVAGGFDAGIRLGETLQPGMVAVPIGLPQRLVVVASPDYLARRGTPRTLEDLAEHDCICFRNPGNKQIRHWHFTRDGREVVVPVNGRLMVNDNRQLRISARAGLGLAMQFDGSIQDDLQQGRLIQVLAEHAAPAEQFHLYFPAREHLPPKLRAFVDFLRAPPKGVSSSVRGLDATASRHQPSHEA